MITRVNAELRIQDLARKLEHSLSPTFRSRLFDLFAVFQREEGKVTDPWEPPRQGDSNELRAAEADAREETAEYFRYTDREGSKFAKHMDAYREKVEARVRAEAETEIPGMAQMLGLLEDAAKHGLRCPKCATNFGAMTVDGLGIEAQFTVPEAGLYRIDYEDGKIKLVRLAEATDEDQPPVLT